MELKRKAAAIAVAVAFGTIDERSDSKRIPLATHCRCQRLAVRNAFKNSKVNEGKYDDLSD